MKMVDIDTRDFSINSKIEKGNVFKIYDDNNYSVYYVLDRRNLDLKIGSGINERANIIFFSKKYSKGILTNFRQNLYHKKESTYTITLHVEYVDRYVNIPSMIIIDKDFNYEYLMKYYYMPLPPPNSNIYTSVFKIQDIKNFCNRIEVDIKGNIIFENIDDILSNISKVSTVSGVRDCNPIILDMDLKDFFPNKIIK